MGCRGFQPTAQIKNPASQAGFSVPILRNRRGHQYLLTECCLYQRIQTVPGIRRADRTHNTNLNFRAVCASLIQGQKDF